MNSLLIIISLITRVRYFYLTRACTNSIPLLRDYIFLSFNTIYTIYNFYIIKYIN